jgi:hypothetical protein
MEVNNIEYQTLLFYKDNNISLLPNKPGIYYWVYFPDIDPNLDTQKFIEEFTKYSSVSLSLPEKFKLYKFRAEVNELWFNDSDNSSLLGLSRGRSQELISYLSESIENRKAFMDYFKFLCFSRPFYVGMTEDLKNRLNSHVTGQGSDILENIELLNIKKNFIWISFQLYPTSMNSKLIKIHEEIYQRFVKPGLTKKFG